MDLSKKSALLVIDMQNDSLPEGFYPVWNMAEVIANAGRVIAACRRHGIPVVYTQHTYRPDGKDIALGEPLDDRGRPCAYVKGTPGWEIVAAPKPEPGDGVIEKTRWSAFYCSPLEVTLRGLGAEQLIVTGVVTDGCVQGTVYDAFYRDYPVVLVKDACGAYNAACHEAAILNMANWAYGLSVISTGDLEAALEDRPHHAWTYRQPNSVPFTAENLHELYAGL